MTHKEKKQEMQLKNQQDIRELEQFYTNGEVEHLLQTIETRKNDLVEKMMEYAERNTKPVKFDKEGNPLDYKVQMNPVVVSNYFFKPITPLTNQEPIYNAEKLGMVFDYYCELLAEVNDKIGNFPSSLSLFCKFAGITTTTLRNYKNSADYNMRVVAEKIYDQVGDENLTMSQMGVLRERSTIFKLKVQNEMVEKVQPTINLNANIIDVDMDKINERLEKYKNYATKKGSK